MDDGVVADHQRCQVFGVSSDVTTYDLRAEGGERLGTPWLSDDGGDVVAAGAQLPDHRSADEA
jgi:hypothetical protein